MKRKRILNFNKFSDNKNKINKKVDKLNKLIITFLKNLKKEGQETSDAAHILKRYALGEKVSKEEMETFRKQMISILKILGIGIPLVILPGSTLLLPLVLSVAKKYNIDILPNSFKKN
jgi:hypothetical protein